MDKNTQYHLEKIGRSIPKELLQKGMRTERDSGEMRERMEYMAKKTGDPKLKKLIQAGAFDEGKRQVIDEKGSKEIERWVDKAVGDSIRSGVIKKASINDYEEGKGGVVRQ